MPEKPRVKAPKQRAASPRAGGGPRREVVALGAASLAIVLVVGAILAFVGFAGGDRPGEAEVRKALEAAGCTLKVVPALPGRHSLGPDDTSKQWNTQPPTNGPHNQETVVYGAYEEPVQTARLVHNLEHGAVYILYGGKVPASAVAQLRAFYERHRNGTILAPYPSLGRRIALGAWVAQGPRLSRASENGSGVLATCTRFDEPAFTAFLDAFQFRGPESSFIRPSDMEPGEQ
ncbi:MAG TPA: DUF3105 domain-containing protein [Gaiellaceae bacterium]|nr:DUF3105 domain-containing protein [Gaiellaceae bacterium]